MFKTSQGHLHYFETLLRGTCLCISEMLSSLMKELKHFCSHGETERDSPRSLNLLPEQERRAFAVCKLLEVKDFKRLSIKPELAGSFNVRLDVGGGGMGVFGHCVGDAVPMRSRRNSSQLVLALSIVRLLFSLS